MTAYMKWDEIPAAIQEKMLERQYDQTGKMDANIFINDIMNNRESGGFNWLESPENVVVPSFWQKVLRGQYSIFYKMYPSAKIKTFPREMLVWDDAEFNDAPPEVRVVIHDLGEEYECRYLVEDGLWNYSTKKSHSMYKYAKEIDEEDSNEPKRYFFLTFSIFRQNTNDTIGYSLILNRFPTHKQCVEFGEEEARKSGEFKSVYLLAITEVCKEDFEIFISETK